MKLDIARSLRRKGSLFGSLALVGVLLTVSLPALSGKDGAASKGRDSLRNPALRFAKPVLRIGPGIPAHLGLPVLPPVKLDYRKDFATEARVTGQHPGGDPAVRPHGGIVAGQTCFNDIDCDDCDPCTIDACTGSICVGGALDGGPCDEDSDCPGTCNGGNRDTLPCSGDLDCCGDAAETDGVCEANLCLPLGAIACVNFPVPAGVASDECDDGFQCNGAEFCEGGVCVDDPPPGPDGVCDEAIGTVCDEINDINAACVAPCTSDEGCDDEKFCTDTETCNADGVCEPGPNACGPGALCEEGTAGPECERGRCCDGNGICTAETFANCTGNWLAIIPTEDACATFGNTSIQNVCPSYGGGISPQGEFGVAIGPISASICDINHIGDDYSVPDGGGAGYMDLELFRFAARIDTTARFAIEFRDAAGRLIEDVFFPDGLNAAPTDVPPGFVIFTVDLDPPLTIPTDGIISISVQFNFGPEGRVNWLSTDAVDLGTNDAGSMYVDGAIVSDFLGQCADGNRDGLWCDRRNADADCTDGGMCNDIDDVLAFELVGPLANAAPLGACCDLVVGECTQQLPWICELPVADGGVGGVFQGVGFLCRACSGDNFSTCLIDQDCTTCQGGDDDGSPCTPGDFGGACFLGGGTCPGGECLDFRPACFLSACCDAATGACESSPLGTPDGQVCQGKFCRGNPLDVGGNAITCSESADCGEDGPCVDVAGFEFQGFGTDCDPDCCEQPIFTGGDNCRDARALAVLIPVPLLDEPPVTVTFSGSNSPATYDDWNTRVCDGGDNDGLDCTNSCSGGSRNTESCDPIALAEDPVEGCPDGGTCTTGDCPGGECTGRLCVATIFDPDGTSADPGWWEAFRIEDCAIIRRDFCCSDPIVRPQWSALYVGCPCAFTVGDTGVDAPVGEGRGTAGFARGGPFCNEDNVWSTYGPLGTGTYYTPVDGAIATTFAAGNNGPGDNYQFHVTVGACPIRACCSTLCESGARDGLPCNSDGLEDCPGVGAECVGGVCVGGILDGIACDDTSVTQCPGGTCGTTNGCSVVNELECGVGNGLWFGVPNIPDDVEEIVSCLGSPCELGSCCLGPGLCEDRANEGVDCDPSQPATCMTQGLCETVLDPPGSFVGGATCDFKDRGAEGDTCPACSAERPGNCNFDDSGFFNTSDRRFGGRVADDFVPIGDLLTQFCWWPGFFDTSGQGVAACENNVVPPDNWIVRVRFDEFGLPGALVPGSPDGIVEIAAKVEDPPGQQSSWQYTVVFDPPISVTPGERYWMEWSGLGVGNCVVRQFRNDNDGNRWALIDTDYIHPSEAEDGIGNDSWSLEDRRWNQTDWQFCVDTGIDRDGAGGQPRGACCRCDGACIEDSAFVDCLGGSDETVQVGVPLAIGNWFPGRTCEDIECVASGGGGGCRPAIGGAVGEDCGNPLVTTGDGEFFSNICSSTDGRLTYTDCDNAALETVGGDGTTVGNDLWFEYTATCTGRLTIAVCRDLGFDAVIAAYTNGTAECSTVCPPPEADLVGGQCLDFQGPQVCSRGSQIETFTDSGVCYKVRVGGWVEADPADTPFAPFNQLGTGKLDIICSETSCEPSSQPQLVQIPGSAGGPDVGLVGNRMIGLNVGDVGASQQIRITFTALPAPFNVWDGTVLWVLEPEDLCELSGVGPNDTCPDGVGFFKVAELTCDPFLAFATDWTAVGTFYLQHPGIVPDGSYTVDVLRDNCNAAEADSFSDALEFTNSKYGDISGQIDIGAGVWTAPDGATDIAPDALASISAFSNSPINPTKLRADLEPCVLDGKVNITDIVQILGGFSSLPYPFGPSTLDPNGNPVCPSSDPCGVSSEVALGR